VCTFCDTDFVGTDGTLGGKYRSAPELAAAVAGEWPRVNGRSRPLVVCTGGEPLLQIDAELVAAFHAAGLEIAVETNGTLTPPDGIDWICVSPKAGSTTVLLRGDELKLVYPQEDAPPERFADTDFEHFYLQPMDGPELAANVASTVAYCLAHPQWRLSLQTHKITGIR
jgi:7-carboxy-7-deazaguanine synthase